MKLDFFLNRELKKVLSSQHRRKRFSNMDGMKNILLFFDLDDWTEIQDVISDLNSLGKNVIAWTVKPKTVKSEAHNPIIYPQYVRIIDLHTDVSWKKTLNPAVLDEFDGLDYDSVIDLTANDNPYLLYLLAKNTSSFCLGIKESEYKMYDFVILKSEEQSILEAYNQIKFYLTKIKENTNNF